MDVFSWSVPFLAEKVTNMLFNLLKKGAGDLAITDDPDIDLDKVLKSAQSIVSDSADLDNKQRKALIMKGKVNSVAKMSKMFTTLREESEMLL